MGRQLGKVFGSSRGDQMMAVSTPVKEHGMLFKSPLVFAIANTTPRHQPINLGLPIKWQTRRIMADPPQEYFDNGFWAAYKHNKVPTEQFPQLLELAAQDAPIKAGDRIWVKEKAKVLEYLEADRKVQLQYESDGAVAWLDYPERLTWTPTSGSYFPRGSLFREAARLVLEVTQVRVQRLQEISEEDAIAEGVSSVEEFKTLWDSINKELGTRWTDNPWVWVYDFKPIVQGVSTPQPYIKQRSVNGANKRRSN